MASTSTFQAILENETIYSWSSTYHWMTCSTRSAETGRSLFGSSHAARQHDLPAALGNSPLFCGTPCDEALEKLRRHTIAGYYLPFLGWDIQQEISGRLRSGQDPHWRRLCSGYSRSHPVHHPLKWCMECIARDQEVEGRAYWHTDHQFPTTWTCPLHGTSLMQRRPSKQWLLPGRQDSDEVNHQAIPMEVAKVLASVGSALPSIRLVDTASLRRTALLRLQELGVIHSIRRASHERICRWFQSTDMARCVQESNTALAALKSGEWIPNILWRRRADTAIHWVILWSTLSWTSPKHAAEAFVDVAHGNALIQGSQLLLFPSSPSSMETAPDHVYEAFETCNSYAEVMRRLKAGRSDVVRWLEMDSGLREAWRQRLRDGKQAECISSIRLFMAGKPEARRQDIENALGAELRWLREHAPSIASSLYKSVPGRLLAQPTLFDRDAER